MQAADDVDSPRASSEQPPASADGVVDPRRAPSAAPAAVPAVGTGLGEEAQVTEPAAGDDRAEASGSEVAGAESGRRRESGEAAVAFPSWADACQTALVDADAGPRDDARETWGHSVERLAEVWRGRDVQIRTIVKLCGLVRCVCGGLCCRFCGALRVLLPRFV